MFTKRRYGIGITYTSGHIPGQEFKNTIENGDSVILHIDNESVLVKNISLLSEDSFSGTVYGFEPSLSLEFNDIKIDDEVKFNREHIISCSSN